MRALSMAARAGIGGRIAPVGCPGLQTSRRKDVGHRGAGRGAAQNGLPARQDGQAHDRRHEKELGQHPATVSRAADAGCSLLHTRRDRDASAPCSRPALRRAYFLVAFAPVGAHATTGVRRGFAVPASKQLGAKAAKWQKWQKWQESGRHGRARRPASRDSSGPVSGRAKVRYQSGSRIFEQGDPAATVMYLQSGNVRLSVVSRTGRKPSSPSSSPARSLVRVVLRDSPCAWRRRPRLPSAAC